jgi:ring-1,2-phenylacetyl-CoA epoxidase subunit PaaE
VHLTFHPLALVGREAVADDAVCLTFAVPPALREAYRFLPGQHIALRATLSGREVRRTYSIIDSEHGEVLRLGLRVQRVGGLSYHLAREVAIGATVEALTPDGRFVYAPAAGGARRYLMFAAGSGITPLLSIVGAVLAREPDSRVTLVYGNRTIASTMFAEDLLALKNRHLDRFAIHFLMSREPQDVALLNGRLDGAAVRALAGALIDPVAADEVYVCGPGSMVTETRAVLVELGVKAPIHIERFSVGAGTPRPVAAEASATAGATRVTVVQDGRRRVFTMTSDDVSVLDAAARNGLDLPYSCRAGVCSTCRARVVSGAVTMAHNVALEDWELAAGFVLCCQARPAGAELELSYDEK